MKKILIFGAMIEHIAQAKLKDDIILVENNIEAKNIVNSSFTPEPIIISNYRESNFEVKINDLPRNKFFDKPKHNFRKK